ncbi:MAG: S1 RNA-binding domain-containing protein [Vicinamibacterales bacterium]
MTEPEEDFAALFEASEKARRIEKGQVLEGTIVGLGPDVAFVNVGGKGEALIDLDELKDADGALEVKVGDRIQAMVTSTDGGLTLSRKLVRGAASLRHLEEASAAGLPVEGKVVRSIKGGFEVQIGHHRAFCPFSQIDLVRQSNPAEHEGRVYTFRIVELKEGGRNIVVSRRALLEEEQQARASEIRQTIVPGAVLTGRVASVVGFGAFVDLGGGIQGLLHVSEMSWSRVSDPAEIVKAGDPITVKVLRVDPPGSDGQRIALGLKQLADDPWSTVEATFAVGQVYTGRVTRVADFGAFVEIGPGIEALAHASTFPPTGTPGGWKRSAPPGLTARFEILNIDLEKKRMGVALVPEGSARGREAAPAAGEIAPGARIAGKVERHEKFGVFVYLAPGKVALMPMSETGVPREGDVAKAFPVGSDVEVVVLEVDPSGRRIRVSRKAVDDAREADEVRAYHERSAADAGQGLGTMADQLRNAMRPPRK